MSGVVDNTAALPVELLSRALDLLDINDVLRASHTCQRWRVTARRSRVFWATISLLAFSDSALEFLVSRLTSSNGLGVSLVMKVPDAPLEVFSIVAPHLAEHLHRIVRLEIHIPGHALLSIEDALEHPAPLLRSLYILLTPGPLNAPFLRNSIFSGRAGRLEHLFLREINFPTAAPALLVPSIQILGLGGG